MIIGFNNGIYHRLHKNTLERLSAKRIKELKTSGSNALELSCITEETIDLLLITNPNTFQMFDYLSIHAPVVSHRDDELNNRIFKKLSTITKKHNIRNIVIHPDQVSEWKIFDKFKNLPFSIENMDNNKKSHKSIKEIEYILNKYPFLNLTLDLQHCYVNDNSMTLAKNFHDTFKNRIVQYHLSGYEPVHIHSPLYVTGQDIIISSLQFKNVPIIIESTFDKEGEHKQELSHIIKKLSQ
jgi:hypothetical protein